MYRETKLYLNDILTSIELIKEYTESLSFEEFSADNSGIVALASSIRRKEFKTMQQEPLRPLCSLRLNVGF
ncbi:MAG: hypothetical protein OIN88_15245 [Candidatus Methanoperedens sp.]|nr:hypothetical protein [Candidatus Methanoperedens sp.]